MTIPIRSLEKIADDLNYNEYKRSVEKYIHMPYYECIGHPFYMSMYTGSYVRKIFGGECTDVQGTHWIINHEEKKLRVTHLSACIHDYGLYPSWNYSIQDRKLSDTVILTAFDYIEMVPSRKKYIYCSRRKL